MVEEPQKLKPVGRVGVIGACLFVLALIVAMELRKHREEARVPSSRSVRVSLQGPEARLAAIQLRHPARSPYATVIRLAWLLDLLEADCPDDTRRGLADLTVNSLRELRASGISATPTDVLDGAAGSQDIGRLSGCKPYFDRYVATRRASRAALR